MKTTGVSDIPKFGLLDFLGHLSTHTVGHTVQVISLFCSYLASVEGIVEVILDRQHSVGDVVHHSWYFLQW